MLDLHAAAMVVDERALVLVGPKQSGKTTLLVSALKSGRAGLLANDRVLIDAEPERPRAWGIPTLVSLRAGTLELCPDLQRDLPERPTLLHRAELRDAETVIHPADRVPREFGLTSAQLASRLGVPIVGRAPLGGIIFLEITSAVDTWSLEQLRASDGSIRLLECRYGGSSPCRAPTIFGDLCGRVTECHEPAGAHAERIAGEIPLYRCRLGPHAYRDGPSAWLRALGFPASEQRP
jgi:hypothetical protein